MSVATFDLARTVPAVGLDDFSFSYPGGSGPALDSVSLDVNTGEFVLVVGRSGSGKSTLLRAAAGLVPHHFGGVAAGEATICSRDLRTTHTAELAAVCGTVLQDPEVQIVMGSVRNEIAFPLENLGWDTNAIAVAVEETALALGIRHLLNRRTNELSGGELQRVVLAAAIAAGQPLVALDEPTSQLDPVAADELLTTLGRLNSDRGTTILLADHRIERCLEVADRVIAFDGGRVACDQPPAEFLAWAAGDQRHQWMLTPTAKMFTLAGISPLPVGAKQARALLGTRICAPSATPEVSEVEIAAPALELTNITFAYGDELAPAVDYVSATFEAGTCTVMMGANGSGKSTLLRIARGVQKQQSGKVSAAGAVGLLLQNPNDYLIHEHVRDEAPAAALERFGLSGFADRDPRDLSVGERQRLALAIVMQDDPVALLLDEPTRGMDRERKQDLAALLRELSAAGMAIVVATHDTEFAAEFADRALLLADGRVLADGSARELLGRGWHFATEIARLMPDSGALTAAQGAALLGGTPEQVRDTQARIAQ
jgi:energy-coupling factor transport system ATP-binding protein